jgi:hypothetical protein
LTQTTESPTVIRDDVVERIRRLIDESGINVTTWARRQYP